MDHGEDRYGNLSECANIPQRGLRLHEEQALICSQNDLEQRLRTQIRDEVEKRAPYQDGDDVEELCRQEEWKEDD